ncbi:hypothetical protein Ancab_034288, partial [Ancistrocladus abbreviatus]
MTKTDDDKIQVHPIFVTQFAHRQKNSPQRIKENFDEIVLMKGKAQKQKDGGHVKYTQQQGREKKEEDKSNCEV